MQYPVWQLPVNGGLLIALISVIHVFVAQFAVGGGFFLVMAERKGHAEGNNEILQWVKRHSRFFVLLTMVFGGVTGVGIWLIISLVSPAATSQLVHLFLYGWATEWVFFLGEIMALLVYYYTFQRCISGRMSKKDHMAAGWLYALFAFLSLFMINGIIGFMLTPGEWLRTGNFWDGFFNPTFWPALVFRFALCLLLAGLFAMITALRIPGPATREAMVRWSAKWVCLPFIGLLLGAAWYFTALPPDQQAMILRRTDDIRPFALAWPVVTPLLFLGGLAFFVKASGQARAVLAGVVLLLGLAQVGTFEWMRETGRRPWVIHGYMYSNGIRAADVERMQRDGALSLTAWAGTRQVTDANRLDVGRFLWAQQCSSCHGMGNPMLDMVPRAAKRGVAGMEAQLAGQGRLLSYMPPFCGTPAERNALAVYIAHEVERRVSK